jgi:transcription elongation factor Elf1
MDYVLTKHDQKILPSAFGLNNAGNTCFANSALQAILSCTAVIKRLSDYRENKAAHALMDVLSGRVTTATRVLDTIGTLNVGRQECAVEALTLLLDKLGPNYEETFICRYCSKVLCPKCGHKQVQDVEYLYTIQMFHIKGTILDHDNNLTGTVCNKCGNVDMLKTYRLVMTSDIIACVYDAYDHTNPIVLDPYITLPAKEGGSLKYELVAQVHHFGSMQGGHYTATVMRNDGIYYIDDSHVKKSEFQMNSPSTYMAIYHYV